MYATGTFNNFRNRLHLASSTGDLFGTSSGYYIEGTGYTGIVSIHYTGMLKQWNNEFLKRWSVATNTGHTGSIFYPYINQSGFYF